MFDQFKILGWKPGDVVLGLLFAIYFPVVFVFLLAHAFLWGIHAMIFGSSNVSPTASAVGMIIPKLEAAIVLGGVIVWTLLLLNALMK